MDEYGIFLTRTLSFVWICLVFSSHCFHFIFAFGEVATQEFIGANVYLFFYMLCFTSLPLNIEYVKVMTN